VKIDEQVYFYNPNLSAAKRFFTTKTRRLKEEQKLSCHSPRASDCPKTLCLPPRLKDSKVKTFKMLHDRSQSFGEAFLYQSQKQLRNYLMYFL
jgi:hypothetical protein